MSEEIAEGTVLEKLVGTLTVRVIAKADESIEELYNRFNRVCDEVGHLEHERARAVWAEEVVHTVKDSVAKIERHYGIVDGNLTETGIVSDYHRVMFSLLLSFDQCMGATAVALEWGGINTGNVSRVFRASRKSTEAYRGHFEECKEGGYRFTDEGLRYALEKGVQDLLGPQEDDE